MKNPLKCNGVIGPENDGGRSVEHDVLDLGEDHAGSTVSGHSMRAAAMNACQGREVPLEVIERWLKDESWRVRAAAMNACRRRSWPQPAHRSPRPSTPAR